DALPGNLWRPTEKLLFFNGLLGRADLRPALNAVRR
ncbi:MAG: hypothetical protein ACI9K5_000761, partial [Gammaproteobacteria bacterium]